MVTMKTAFIHLLFFIPEVVLGIGQKTIIAFNSTTGSLDLASGGSAVQIIADQADWPAVLRAANDLTLDFGRVTGKNGSLMLINGTDNYNVSSYNAGTEFSEAPNNASIIFNITGMSSFERPSYDNNKGGVILAGTIGQSSIIDKLISSGKIDVSAIQGTWEAFISKLVSEPYPGVASALVIAGTCLY